VFVYVFKKGPREANVCFNYVIRRRHIRKSFGCFLGCLNERVVGTPRWDAVSPKLKIIRKD
jgi:hypothetical protein